MPNEVVQKVNAERQEIINGKQVYAGPLKDRDGKDRVAAGQVLEVMEQIFGKWIGMFPA